MMNFLKTGGGKIFACFFISISILLAEEPDSTLVKLSKQSENIEYASEIFNIDPIKLETIIYVERTNNYDWRDEFFDDYLAQKGGNSSIGFCQVKLKTAYWIECQLSDSSSEFYPGKKYDGHLSISQSPQEIINKLENDRINLLYAAAYMRIILSYWKNKGYSIDDRVDIVATIFSYGIFSRETGEPLKPNNNPQPNWFGVQANEAYMQFINIKK